MQDIMDFNSYFKKIITADFILREERKLMVLSFGISFTLWGLYRSIMISVYGTYNTLPTRQYDAVDDDVCFLHFLKALHESGKDVNEMLSDCFSLLSKNLIRIPAIHLSMNYLLEMGANFHTDSYILQLVNHEGMNNFTIALIEQGINLNITDNEGCTTIQRAFYHDNNSLFNCFLNRGLELLTLDKIGRTPLFYAKNAEQVDYLLDLGADINFSNAFGERALSGHRTQTTSTVQRLLERGAEVNYQDNNGMTPLMIAAKYYYSYGNNSSSSGKYLQIAELLIQFGADLYIRHPITDMTAFLYSSESAELEIMQLLLRDRAHINDVCCEGKSALMFAVQGAAVRVLPAVKWLVKQGIDLSLKSKTGESVLDCEVSAAIKDYLIQAKEQQNQQHHNKEIGTKRKLGL